MNRIFHSLAKQKTVLLRASDLHRKILRLELATLRPAASRMENQIQRVRSGFALASALKRIWLMARALRAKLTRD